MQIKGKEYGKVRGKRRSSWSTISLLQGSSAGRRENSGEIMWCRDAENDEICHALFPFFPV